MINFEIAVCPKCGRKTTLMKSNNPLTGVSICFDCISNNLDYSNLSHADFFCRTYNLPFNPDLWISISSEYKSDTFRQYTSLMLDDTQNKPNLAYSSSTHDLWDKANKEWEKTRSFAEILEKLPAIKESYIARGRLKWGEQYTFEDLLKLDSIYTRTLRANNVTNPLQKEAVKTLCKLQIEMDEAIRAKDAKAIKDFSTAWSTFAKQADLEQMINDTRTDDITTVSELYQYFEDNGFRFNFYDNQDRDEVDRTVKDIQKYLRTLVLESTGLQPLLEQMAQKRLEAQEEEQTGEAISRTTLQDLIDFNPEDTEIDTEEDSDILSEDFSEEKESEGFFKDDLGGIDDDEQ